MLKRSKLYFLSFFLIAFAFGGIASNAKANSLLALEKSFQEKEKAVSGLKEKASTFFQWANPNNPQKTPYVLVYFHGFSSSPKESSPLVENLAKSMGANAFFPRWTGHGIDGRDGLKGVRLEDWQKDTREILETASLLGHQTIPVGMSMGAGLLIPEMTDKSFPAAILLSPNFKVYRWNSELLRIPYLGLWLGRILVGDYREWKARNPEHDYHWTTAYPIEILAEVVKSAKRARDTQLEKIQTPAFFAYSEKDTVSNHHYMLAAYERWGSKIKKLFHANGNNDAHNLAGDILSKDYTPVLEKEILHFFHKEAGIK